MVVFLPGSRRDEVRRHWPVVTGTFETMRHDLPHLSGKILLPNDLLAQSAEALGLPNGLEVQVGGLNSTFAQADLAITKSGTITVECALHGVPAVVFYKTSWPTYLIGKQIVTVKYLAMPNLLAGEELFPEFVQQQATPENIAAAALAILKDSKRRRAIQSKLEQVIASLGEPGAAARAASAILGLLR